MITSFSLWIHVRSGNSEWGVGMGEWEMENEEWENVMGKCNGKLIFYLFFLRTDIFQRFPRSLSKTFRSKIRGTK